MNNVYWSDSLHNIYYAYNETILINSSAFNICEQVMQMFGLLSTIKRKYVKRNHYQLNIYVLHNYIVL